MNNALLYMTNWSVVRKMLWIYGLFYIYAPLSIIWKFTLKKVESAYIPSKYVDNYEISGIYKVRIVTSLYILFVMIITKWIQILRGISGIAC